MGLKPTYRIIANQADITAAIIDRFVSLRWSDAVGFESDMLEIVLSDHDPLRPINIPPTGAELELFLGYDNVAQRIGLFVVDEIELSGDPGEMSIRARAAPYDASKGGKTNLQTQKTRSWPNGTKLGDMASKIAKEHGLEPAVSASLKSISLPHIDQADESDINLLIRIAKKYDAAVKPSGGKLVLAKRGEGKSISGGDLPEVTIMPNERTSWRMMTAKRESAGTVVAYYHKTKQSKRHEVKVGTGEPVRRLKMYHPTQDQAKAAAQAELSRRERGMSTLSVSMPGRTDLLAEGKLTLSGWRTGVPTEWIITRVEHTLDVGGYKSSIEAELPNSGETESVEDNEE